MAELAPKSETLTPEPSPPTVGPSRGFFNLRRICGAVAWAVGGPWRTQCCPVGEGTQAVTLAVRAGPLGGGASVSGARGGGWAGRDATGRFCGRGRGLGAAVGSPELRCVHAASAPRTSPSHTIAAWGARTREVRSLPETRKMGGCLLVPGNEAGSHLPYGTLEFSRTPAHTVTVTDGPLGSTRPALRLLGGLHRAES